MINTKLQSIIDTKSAIGNAITNKGGTITTNTPFFNYAAEIDSISTGSVLTGNATTSDVLNGFTFYSNDANTQLTGTFVAPQIDGLDEAKMFLVAESNLFGRSINSSAINNGYVYIGGLFSSTINRGFSQYHESNLVLVANSPNYATNGTVITLAINNGFIYAGGLNQQSSFPHTNSRVTKYFENNLAFSSQALIYGGGIRSITINNGFIYAGGDTLSGTNRGVAKYHESNLTRVGNTVNYGGVIRTITTNNGFIYVGGTTNQRVQKFYEDNLAFVGNTAIYGNNGDIFTIKVNNGFIYVAGGGPAPVVQKFNESTLAFVGNATSPHSGVLNNLVIDNGFIYAGGGGDTAVSKHYESNLGLIGSSKTYGSTIQQIQVNNGHIYAFGDGQIIAKYLTATQFTNALNGQSWYLLPKE